MATSKSAGKTGKAKKTVEQTWNEITGTMRVYGNTFEIQGKKGQTVTKWSVSVSGKNKGGEYENYYLPVKFRGRDANEPETDGLHTIEIERAFLSLDCYENRNGENVSALVLVIVDNEVTE